VERITANLAMDYALTVVENFQALRGTNSEFEEGLQSHGRVEGEIAGMV
jgi:hypothetical protein